MRQSVIPLLAFFRVQYMPFKLIPEMPYRSCHRPCCCISQRADRIAFYLSLNIPQQIDITQLSFSKFNVLQYSFHPSRSLATGRTLTTALMPVKSCKGQCMMHHALV